MILWVTRLKVLCSCKPNTPESKCLNGTYAVHGAINHIVMFPCFFFFCQKTGSFSLIEIELIYSVLKNYIYIYIHVAFLFLMDLI